MKLEEIRKLCEKATPGPWARSIWESGSGTDLHFFAIGPDGGRLQAQIDANFMATVRDVTPKLIEVAMAAKRLSDNIAEFDAPTDSCFLERLDEALAALEAE